MKRKIIVNGSKGRMGKTVLACASSHEEIEVVGQIDLGDDIGAIIADCDVVVDFSSPEGSLAAAIICCACSKPMVIGTTGHMPGLLERITEISRNIPIVKATNFSTGVNALFWLTRKVAEILGPDFDLEIVEMHHRHKKDAPSGTAKTLAEILTKVRNQQHGDNYTLVRCGRQESKIAVRMPSEIGIHAIRGGDVVGDHTVIFAGDGERVELIHKASSRETFANGALRAALWVVEQPPGLYSMQHVLGLV